MSSRAFQHRASALLSSWRAASKSQPPRLLPAQHRRHNHTRRVELRSDTFTMPCEGMRRAMYQAEVGDDVFGEDKTVMRLEQEAAALLGKEAAMFCASGTMGNLLSLSVHCQRGEEVILGDENHVFQCEAGGASTLLGVPYHTVPTLEDGTYDLQHLQDVIREDNFHYAISRVVAVENTHNRKDGNPLPVAWLRELGALCRSRGLIFHMDGARLMNAAVAEGQPASEVVADADSISLCLSKGLGAPVGSLAVGSKDFIRQAKRTRKMIGGGWRQAGVLAAAGLYALQHNVSRLAEDHANAHRLATGLAHIPGIVCEGDRYRTNIIYLTTHPESSLGVAELVERLKVEHGVYMGVAGYQSGKKIRAVTSLMVTQEDTDHAINSVRSIMASSSSVSRQAA